MASLAAWRAGNAQLIQQATAARQRSQDERAQAHTTIRNTTADMQQTQRAVQGSLEARVEEIESWKKEVSASIEAAEAEIAALLETKQQVEAAIQQKERPTAINSACQANRQRRQAPDLVPDQVDAALAEESSLLSEVVDVLRGKHAVVVEHLRLVRVALFRQREDIRDKALSHSIDSGCVQLDATNRSIGLFRDSPQRAAQRAVEHREWEQHTASNLDKCAGEIAQSSAAREDIASLLAFAAEQLAGVGARVDAALASRLEECTAARTQISEQLAQVKQEIAEQDKAILDLKDALAAHEPPLMLATTRLDKRTQRPNIERVTDTAHHALVKEVGDLDISAQQLSVKLGQNEEALKGLLRSKVALEKDVAVKNASIAIDTDCVQLRAQS